MNWDETMATYKREGRQSAKLEAQAARLELDKRDYLADGIKALVGNVNGLTGKPHSATSAEKEVREHPEYRAHHERIIAVRLQMHFAGLEANGAEMEMQRHIGERMAV